MAIDTEIDREIRTALQGVVEAIELPTPLRSEELAAIVQTFAASPAWLDRVRLRADRRWYERLYHGAEYDVWLISWMPEQSTGFHDHGDSSGAFLVITGTLEEHRPNEPSRRISVGDVRAFGSNYAHDVRNVSNAPAVSIHAYSPPLTLMNAYELEGDQLIPRRVETRGTETQDFHGGSAKQSHPGESPQTIDEMLAAARLKLKRLSPREAYAARVEADAVLVDIRPESQRALEGSIEGAWVVERNVLEWRFDPVSSARLPIATTHGLQIILFCSEGYTSSLAAASLQSLGLWRATDIVGGIKAWREAGLPTTPGGVKL